MRDRHGIPHIYAASLEDAHFALGFVHAQDRLWQMEMNRRIGSGRLAEILGAECPSTASCARWGCGAWPKRTCATTPRRAGCRRLRSGSERLPSSTPSPPARVLAARGDSGAVDPVDSGVWTKVMAWDLGANWRSELLRMQLSRVLTTERIQEFLPPYPAIGRRASPTCRPSIQESRRSRVDPGVFGERLSSRIQQLGGFRCRTASGKPLLAADPHLGLTAPPVWYFAHLHAPGIDAIGGTLPACLILIGRNDRIAWGSRPRGRRPGPLPRAPR